MSLRTNDVIVTDILDIINSSLDNLLIDFPLSDGGKYRKSFAFDNSYVDDVLNDVYLRYFTLKNRIDRADLSGSMKTNYLKISFVVSRKVRLGNNVSSLSSHKLIYDISDFLLDNLISNLNNLSDINSINVTEGTFFPTFLDDGKTDKIKNSVGVGYGFDLELKFRSSKR